MVFIVILAFANALNPAGDLLAQQNNSGQRTYSKKELQSIYRFYGKRERLVQEFAPIDKQQIQPGDVYIEIVKKQFALHVYHRSGKKLYTYPVVFGRQYKGSKTCEGDKKTPEGAYHIVSKKMDNRWHRMMMIDYPNAEDKVRFTQCKASGILPSGATIGGGIGIHGTTGPSNDLSIDLFENWTDGCISTKNAFIEDLFNYIPTGTTVYIKP